MNDDEREIMAALLAAEFTLAATLRLMKQGVPPSEWPDIIARSTRLLENNANARRLMDVARSKMGLPKEEA